MKRTLGLLLAGSALMVGPAAAQNAASLLQAADKAVGASAVNSVQYTATGWMGYPGQPFGNLDLPRSDLKSLHDDDRLPEQVLERGLRARSG